MGQIIAIANRKGGTGKTTVALALATRLAEQHRVLLIDLDSQANATEGLAVPLAPEVAKWLIMEERPALASFGRLDVMPGNAKTEQVNMTLSADADYPAIHRGLKLLPGYDYVILDCPPSLSMLTKTAIFAADAVLVPTTPEYWGVAGVRQLTELIAQMRQKFSRPVRLLGIQPNKYDRRTTEHKSNLVDLVRVYGVYGKENGRVWPPLRQSIAVATASAEGKPLWSTLEDPIRSEWNGMVERVVRYG